MSLSFSSEAAPLVAATAASIVRVASRDAHVSAAADVGRGSGAALVELRVSADAVHAPLLSSTEGRFVAVSVQANSLVAFCRKKGVSVIHVCVGASQETLLTNVIKNK